MGRCLTNETRERLTATFHKILNNGIVSCVAGSLILWSSFGVRQTFGVFLIPVTEETGWDRSTFSIGAALLQLFWGFSQPFLVYFAERKLGFAKTIFFGSIVYGAGCFVMYGASQSSGLFIFAMGIIVGGAAGANSFPNVLASIGRRYPQGSRQQSIAYGIVSSFGSFGQCCFLPIARAALVTVGWRWALIIMGLVMIVLAPLAVFLQSTPQVPALSKDSATIASDTPNEELGTSEKKSLEAPSTQSNPPENGGISTMNDDNDQTIMDALKAALSSVTFLLITLGFTVCGFHIAFLSMHLPAYLQDNGIDASIAAWTISVLGLGSMIGTILSGMLCARVRPKYVLTGIYALRFIIIAVFLWVPLSLTTVFIFSAVFGLAWLSTVPPTTKFVGDMFGHKYIGTLTSITFVGHQIGAFFGAYIGGVVYDSLHNYDRMWYASIAVAAIATVANLFAPDKPLASSSHIKK